MRLSQSIFNTLGIAAALSLPAVVVAQQFVPQTVLTAESLNQLVRRIEVLERGSGPGAQLVGRVTASGNVSVTARSDGFVVALPSNTNFEDVTVNAAVSSGTGSRHFRSTEGDSLIVIVSSGEVATFAIGGLNPPATVTLHWYPLRRNGALPTCTGCS